VAVNGRDGGAGGGTRGAAAGAEGALCRSCGGINGSGMAAALMAAGRGGCGRTGGWGTAPRWMIAVGGGGGGGGTSGCGTATIEERQQRRDYAYGCIEQNGFDSCEILIQKTHSKSTASRRKSVRLQEPARSHGVLTATATSPVG